MTMPGVHSRSGCVWCAACEDFVYDPQLERLRIERSAGHSGKLFYSCYLLKMLRQYSR
jgi:hypothetical protein